MNGFMRFRYQSMRAERASCQHRRQAQKSAEADSSTSAGKNCGGFFARFGACYLQGIKKGGMHMAERIGQQTLRLDHAVSVGA